MSEGQPTGKELTSEHGLEEVAKGLAQGTVSRRKALGALGGILGSGLLAALIPGVASAQTNEQPRCVECCKDRYAPGEKITVDGVQRSARGYCISQSAQIPGCYGRCADVVVCPPECNGNGNGNGDDECEYHEDKVCLIACPDGTVRTLSEDGSGSTCEPDDTGIAA